MEQLANFFTQKAVDADGRRFEVCMQLFENGTFASVSEGGRKIGSITVSLVSGAGAEPATTNVIPPRDQGVAFFMRMASEQISSRLGGIAIVSVSTNSDLSVQSSRALLEEIVEMIKYEKRTDN